MKIEMVWSIHRCEYFTACPSLSKKSSILIFFLVVEPIVTFALSLSLSLPLSLSLCALTNHSLSLPSSLYSTTSLFHKSSISLHPFLPTSLPLSLFHSTLSLLKEDRFCCFKVINELIEKSF